MHFVIDPPFGGTRVPLVPPCAAGRKLLDLVGQQQVIESLGVACRAAIEIHGLSRPIAELLYELMDQKKICVVGATTNPDLMPKPLRDRFTLQRECLP